MKVGLFNNCCRPCMQAPRIGVEDMEKREKLALERKLSEMEEELKVSLSASCQFLVFCVIITQVHSVSYKLTACTFIY